MQHINVKQRKNFAQYGERFPGCVQLRVPSGCSLLLISHILTLLNPTTMEALMNGHPQDAKKVTITGAGH